MAELHDSSDRGGTPRDLLRVVFRRQWIFFTVVAVTLAWVVYMVLQMAPTYESQAKLLVKRGYQTTAFSPGVRIVAWEEEFASEVETISSDMIKERAEEILAEEGIVDSTGAPLEIDAGAIRAETTGKAHIILIYYRGRDSETVQNVVRAVTQAYKEFRTRTRHPDPTGYLQEEINELVHEVEEWERRRAEFLMDQGVARLPEERSNLLIQRRGIESDLIDMRAGIADQRARLGWLHTYSEGEREDQEAGLYAFHDPSERGEPVLLTLRRKILDGKAEYFGVRAEYTDSHPRVLALQDRLGELEEALERETEGYVGYLESRLDAVLARETSLQASLDYINEQLSTFPHRDAQLARLDRTLDRLGGSLDALTRRQLDVLTTRAGANPWDVVVLRDAVEPYLVKSLDYVRLVVILLFSIFVGIGLALLFDNLDHSFRERSEMEAHLSLPVLASISKFRK